MTTSDNEISTAEKQVYPNNIVATSPSDLRVDISYTLPALTTFFGQHIPYRRDADRRFPLTFYSGFAPRSIDKNLGDNLI